MNLFVSCIGRRGKVDTFEKGLQKKPCLVVLKSYKIVFNFRGKIFLHKEKCLTGCATVNVRWIFGLPGLVLGYVNTDVFILLFFCV